MGWEFHLAFLPPLPLSPSLSLSISVLRLRQKLHLFPPPPPRASPFLPSPSSINRRVAARKDIPAGGAGLGFWVWGSCFGRCLFVVGAIPSSTVFFCLLLDHLNLASRSVFASVSFSAYFCHLCRSSLAVFSFGTCCFPAF